MTKKTVFLAAAFVLALTATPALAIKCSNSSAGFNGFKKEFAKYAASNGVGKRGVKALLASKYSNKTKKFDVRQARSFKSSGRTKTNIEKFYRKKVKNIGGFGTAKSKMKKMRRTFDRIEKRFGVQREILTAIWGMETAYGGFTGNTDVLNSLATLSHDCRRKDLFRRNLLAAMKIIDNGWIPRSRFKGARHGEIGQTQFMAENYVKYAVDGNGDGRRDLIGSSADALFSAANLLARSGWTRMGTYKPGSHNFRVLNSWNESTAYQHSVSRIAANLK
jgi:lytic murein transglycosylase